MLVLTRKINEKIRIGPDIVISVVSVSENQVKIGIEAPASVKILRDELYENVKNLNVEAIEKSKKASIEDLKSLKIKKINNNE